MSYLILWRAIDKPALFEHEEYETWPSAKKALDDLHSRYPWNTYLLVRVEDAKPASAKPPGQGTYTIVASFQKSDDR